MRIPRVFTYQKALDLGQSLVLEPEASHHLAKVLRMCPGRKVKIFNGDGREYLCTIEALSKKHVSIRVESYCSTTNESPLNTLLAIALSKGDRFEWVLQKASELGVNQIIPLFTQRSEVKLPKNRIDKKMQSWHKIIIGACEQSQRNILPSLLAPKNLNDFVENCDSEIKLVLHHRSELGLEAHIKPRSVSILIGPEGGLSDQEITLAKNRGFLPLSLGSRVLRTETAPVTALSIVQYLWGDLS